MPGRLLLARARRPTAARSIALAALLIAVLAALNAACSPAPAPTSPAAVGSVSSLPPPLQATSAAVPTDNPAVSPPANEPPSTGPAVAVDPSLLAVLPAEIAGHPLDESPEAEANAIGDPSLEANVARLATAFVHDDALENWAIVSVVALRAGVFGEAFFRSWRDSFDTGVCASAGGVTGHAEATIGAREVVIGSCAGGVRTYHVRLAQGDLLISISAVGESRYGELVIGGLRP